MNDTQFNNWLGNEDIAIRAILVEVGVVAGGIQTTLYLSTTGFTTSPTDTPANRAYLPMIAGGVSFNESISIDGRVSMSYGDIELYNLGGEFDNWLNYVWAGQPITIFIGDMRWARSDYRTVYSGVVTGVDSRSRNRINLKLSDKLQRLNAPISETPLGGSTANKDQLIPLLFGECHNISPLLVDPVTNEYQVHNGPIEGVFEVRDNGVPVQYTQTAISGKFRLLNAPVGTITCSAQGDKRDIDGTTVSYSNRVTQIIRRIVTRYGHGTAASGYLAGKFTTADLDETQLATFDAANTQAVGIYCKDRENTLEVCNRLAASIGAQVTMSRAGKMRIVKLDPVNVVSTTNIGPKDMAEMSLAMASMPPVVAAVKIGYCKNYTVQTGLQTGIPQEHIDLFAREWLETAQKDYTIALTYKQFSDPEMIQTQLLTASDAAAEATRRLNMFKVQRKVLRYDGMRHLLLQELGAGQTITHSRYGLWTGVKGQIISISTDWITAKVDIEVLI
jgi:hypothetical protein